jgi:release factor glutamine methyltransferase
MTESAVSQFPPSRRDTAVLEALAARLRAAGCVFAEEEARLLTASATSDGQLDALVERRTNGMPLEHLLGWAEFCGLRIGVDTGVFVPRRRTEFLVRQAALLLRDSRLPYAHARGARPPVVVDLCCGSGAVGAALAVRAGPVELHASDIDAAAVRCARRNLLPLGEVYEGDLYEPLPARLRGRIDVLAVNAPYVPSAGIRTMPPEARLHEPLVSLDGGADGLDVQRRVAAAAPQWLAPGGHLLVETSLRQAPLTADLFLQNGLTARVAGSEELDATVVIGRS